MRCFLGRLLPPFNSQAKQTHVRPDGFNILETVSFVACLSGVPPTRRIRAVGWPDRVLFLVVSRQVSRITSVLANIPMTSHATRSVERLLANAHRQIRRDAERAQMARHPIGLVVEFPIADFLLAINQSNGIGCTLH